MAGSAQSCNGLVLWRELGDVPAELVLYGGAAVALHPGRRQSVDFDLFGDRPLDPAMLAPAIPFLALLRQGEDGHILAAAALPSFAGRPCAWHPGLNCPGGARC